MSNCEILRQSLLLVWRSSPRLALACMAGVVARSLLPLAVLWTMGEVVDSTLASFGTFKESVTDGLLSIAATLGLFGLAMAGSHIASHVADLQNMRLGETIRARVADLTQRQMCRMSYQTMQNPQIQTETFRALSGSTERPVRIFMSALSLSQSALTFCALSAWMVRLAWWLPLLTMAAGAPLVVARLWATRRAFDLYRRQSVDERKMAYYNDVLTNHGYAPEVRLFGLGGYFRHAFDAVRHSLSSSRLVLARKSAWTQGATGVVSTVIVLSVFVCVIVMTALDSGSIGSLAMYLMTVRRAETAVGDVAHRSVSLHSQGLYMRSLFDFLRIDERRSPHAAFPTGFGEISLRNVCFSYPASERRALRGVSMSIRRGEIVGIAGSNGSGKSTLVKILCGLLRPASGSASVDGVEIADMAPEEISRHITAVFQDFRLYCVSARDNIHFGDISTPLDESRMLDAARDMRMDALLASLPDGYDTELGNQFPGSEMFSRGEWQRLAMARALYSPAEIIILDEAASSLDPTARRTLAENVAHLKRQGKTIIIVSHSSETLSIADRVYEMG